MIAKRKRHEATFKSRVALEALKGNKTIQEIASEYEVHPGQISDWKRILAEGLALSGPFLSTDDTEVVPRVPKNQTT